MYFRRCPTTHGRIVLWPRSLFPRTARSAASWSVNERWTLIQVWQAPTPCWALQNILLATARRRKAMSKKRFAYLWMLFAGVAKIQGDEFEDATTWLKRSIDTNTNSPWAHFHLGVALYLMDRLPEARTAVQAGLRLDPSFTTERYRSFAVSDDDRYMAIRERTIQALQASGVP